MNRKAFKTPLARLIAHTAVAFCAAFFPLWLSAGQPLDKSALIGLVAAAARLALGLTTTTNPGVGKNVV
jgi:hypothetical protein